MNPRPNQDGQSLTQELGRQYEGSGLLGDAEARPEASKAAVARGLSWLQCLMLFASSGFLCMLCTSMMTFLGERRKGSQSQGAATCKSEQGEPMCGPSTQIAFPGEAGHLGKDKGQWPEGCQG